MAELSHGTTVTTAGVSAWLQADEENFLFVFNCLTRHLRCDWGELDAEDAAANNHATVVGGERLLSAYAVGDELRPTDPTLWIITEADRSATTILWPSEY